MQSRPRREMQNERAAGVLVKFKLNPRVVSVQVDANHAGRPATTAGDELPLIERGEPTVRNSHLVVQSDRARSSWRVLRGRETGGVSVNGWKVHDSSVCVCRCASAAHLLPRMGASMCRVRNGVGLYGSAAGEQAKRMTKRRAPAPFAPKTGGFGAEIYFRAQVFHRMCTLCRHLFHSLFRRSRPQALCF